MSAPRLTRLALAAALVAAPAGAQSFDAARIADAAEGDWNRDGLPDLALLVEEEAEGQAYGLHLFLRDEERETLSAVLSLPGRIWGDRIAGRTPSLAALPNGSLALTERNESVGRDRWTLTRTIALRDDRFLIAGATFETYDTLQEKEPLFCDLNLIAGRGVVNGAEIRFERLVLPLDEWTESAEEDRAVRICRESRP